MLNRIIGVLRLDVNTFEEIEHDKSATGQAAIIVAVVAVLTAIGSFFGVQTASAVLEQMQQQFGEAGIDPTMAQFAAISPIGAALNAFISAFVGWLLWSVLTYLIGTNLFKGQATIGEMLRVLGFAQAPRLLGIFGFIPCLGAIIGIIAAFWSLVAGFIAVRQGLDIDNTKTAITVVLSWLIAVVFNLCVLGPIFALIA